MPHQSHDFLTVGQVAERLQVRTETVRRMIARGEIKAVRFGRLIRVRPNDLQKSLKPVTNLAELRGGSVG